MTPPNFALFFTCLFIGDLAHVATLKQELLHFELVKVGGSVTLPCLCQDQVAVMFYWYKQSLGQKPNLVSTFYKHNNNGTFHGRFQKDPRFSLITENNKNNLKISDLQISDTATYYCLKSNLLDFEFCEGTVVSVQGSGLNIPAQVHQSASESIQPGGSVTLNCTVHTGTCDGEHRVYWFKHSGQAHPGLIYTHGGSNDQCERKPETQTHSCVYNLPMNSLNLSDAGTYYCAVASCGRVLFGNGTRLNIEHKSNNYLVYFLSGALTITTILVVLLALSVYKISKRNNVQCTASKARSSAPLSTNLEDYQNTENVHYAALSVNLPNRPRRQRNNSRSECVYSSVKQ
ncbi:uncharacterized protein LOC113142943 [Mastacembelus armatus]|uniref:Immunoglobulin kappa light chain-like n=1 Tax=Mastacembelus armatus TaxID=205130 RepID=A0A3Q3LGS0_9TELE|nr:uncharacterized protein LOC113142943 [Mastacembelus armatus]